MPIINASNEVIEKIKEMLAANGSDEKQLRIVGSLGFGEIPEGFKLMPSEITSKDHVEEIGGLTFMVANILVKLYKSFKITYEEKGGIPDLKIVPQGNHDVSGAAMA